MIPPGWRLVPEEPTDAMLSATMLDGHWSYPEAISGNPADWVRGAYRVMLEASPPLPEVGDETVERMALAIQAADNTASGPMEGAASGLSDEVSDWGAFLARAALGQIKAMIS